MTGSPPPVWPASPATAKTTSAAPGSFSASPTPASPPTTLPSLPCATTSRSVTLRAQIVADGTFPHELTTPNPYRNSLFNLDLLAAACDLLSTRFENLWEFQLQDGPGLHVAVARHVPYIENRGAWPYRADARLFNDLPGRRPALLFAARAYGQPEYANLWRSLNPDPSNSAILRTFPIRQPVLWVTRPQP